MFQMGQSTNDTVRQAVSKESLKYKDIILGNFTDIFDSLPTNC